MKEEQTEATQKWKLYLYLMKCAIRNEKLQPDVVEPYGNMYEVMVAEACKDGQQFLMSDVLEQYAILCKETDKIYKIPLREVILEYEKYKSIRNVLHNAEEAGIPLVVFKGCVLADLYPKYIWRQSCDTDLYVDKPYQKQALNMLLDMGYVINEKHCKNEVTVLTYPENDHMIELHTCLWEDFRGKRMDIMDSFALTAGENLIELEVCGFKVHTLGYEEHLIYQIFHIIKHFSLEGIGVKYLADITLYVDKYGKYIDYDHFWDRLNQLGYTKFTHCMFVLCVEYLGMNKDILRGRKLEMTPAVEQLMSDLFHSGKIYGKKSDNWQILGMMTPYFTGEKYSGKGKIQRYLAVIFLRPKDLQDCYGFAKKHPILLPIAWVKRIMDYLIKYHKDSDRLYNAGEKLNLAERRIDLLDQLDLLDNK